MPQQIRPWLVTGLLGATGGLLYWALADQLLSLTHSSLVERLVIGVVAGVAVQAFTHFRSAR